MAFDNKRTADVIAATGRHDLLICDVVTEVAVLLACFDAVRNGYEMHMPMDACVGMSKLTEEAACRRIESFDANTAETGLIAATEFARLGVPVRLVDKREGPTTPRAQSASRPARSN